MSVSVRSLLLSSFLVLGTAYAHAIEADQLSKIQTAAKSGDAGAQRKLGTALIKGDGVPKDIAAGTTLLEQAAAKDVWAKVTLAGMLMSGADLPLDKTRAISLYEEAAAKNNSTAFATLGMIYLNGNGVTADPVKGRDYFEKAMALGDVGAQKNLGVALIKSQGVPKDVTRGTQLLQAASEKDPWAKLTWAGMLLAGTDLPGDKPRAIALYEQLAADKNGAAMNALGSIYLNGNGVAADPVKGHDYFEKAMALGDVGAQKNLGIALIKGQGVPKDVTRGTQLLQAAAEKDPWAKFTLAGMLLAGTDLSGDKPRAIALYEQLAADKNGAAMNALGSIYLNGNGVAADPVKGHDYFEKAMALGDVGAQKNLGIALIKGQGVPKDVTRGTQLLQAAAEKDPWAKLTWAGMLLAGTDLPSDKPRAIALYEQLAADKNGAAMNALGSIYLNGNGVTADPVKSRDYFEKAIALGEAAAQKNLGVALIKGQGLPKDVAAGSALLEQAAAKDVWAKLILAGYLLKGDFIKGDVARATKLFKEAAEEGQPSGFETLGYHYLKKPPSKTNEALAVKYFTAAAKLGRGSAWVALANAKLGKKLPHTKASFGFYAEQARASGNTSIENSVASRYLWGTDGVKQSNKKFVNSLESSSNKGNPDTARTLIRNFRDGVPTKIQKNLMTAKSYLARYKSLFTEDQVNIENFLLRIASAKTPAGYKLLLTAAINQPFFQRPEIQSQILAANKNFMVYRAQAGLRRGGIYKGPLSGTLTELTLQAMGKACKRLTCTRPMSEVDNFYQFATTW